MVDSVGVVVIAAAAVVTVAASVAIAAAGVVTVEVAVVIVAAVVAEIGVSADAVGAAAVAVLVRTSIRVRLAVVSPATSIATKTGSLTVAKWQECQARGRNASQRAASIRAKVCLLPTLAERRAKQFVREWNNASEIKSAVNVVIAESTNARTVGRSRHPGKLCSNKASGKSSSKVFRKNTRKATQIRTARLHCSNGQRGNAATCLRSLNLMGTRMDS